MKTYFLIHIFYFVFSFTLVNNTILAQEIKNQNVMAKRSSVKLPELKITDSIFIKYVDSLVIKQTAYAEKIRPHIYVMLVRKHEYEDDLYEKHDNDREHEQIEVAMLPFSAIEHSNNLGFFKIDSTLFVVRGQLINNLMHKTGNNEKFQYVKIVVKIDGHEFPYEMMQIEDFPRWIFNYNYNELTLTKTYWIPQN